MKLQNLSTATEKPSTNINDRGTTTTTVPPNRRRTRTRSNGSNNYDDDDDLFCGNSSEEEDFFVDHVSALLNSSQHNTNEQQQNHRQQCFVERGDMMEDVVFGESIDLNNDLENRKEMNADNPDGYADPPIVEYDTSRDEEEEEEDSNIHDINTPYSNNTGQKVSSLSAQQIRLRELIAKSDDDDCWGADLSDEEMMEGPNNIIRRYADIDRTVSSSDTLKRHDEGIQSSSSGSSSMNHQSRIHPHSSSTVMTNNNNVGKDDTTVNTVQETLYTPKRKNSTSPPPPTNNTNPTTSINIQNMNYRQRSSSLAHPDQLISGKEQLLQQRILHQQMRLQRKHSNGQKKLEEEKKMRRLVGMESSTTGVSDQSGGMTITSERIRQLTTMQSTQKSGLFTELDENDDNSSVVASNGRGVNTATSSSSAAVTAAVSAMKNSTSSSSPPRKISSSSLPSSPQRSKPSTSSSSQSSLLSSLHSLPSRPTVQTFPDEADRKRIVGCLAAILASSYTHETAPHLMVKKTSLKQKEEFYEEHSQQQQLQQDMALNESTLLTRPSLDSSLSSSSLDARDQTASKMTRMKPQHEQNIGNNHPLSIDHNNSSATPSINTHQVLQPHKQQQQLILQQSSATSPQHHAFSKDHSSHGNNNNSKPSFHQHFTTSINNQFQKASLSGTSSTQPPTKLKDELAEIRHRIRRHAIYSELLVSSADLLLLDPSHAKAFLPMLEGLLTKVEVEGDGRQGNNSVVGNNEVMMGSGSNHGGRGQLRESWKGRGFGGGGVSAELSIQQQLRQEAVSLNQHQVPNGGRVRSNSVPRCDQSTKNGKIIGTSHKSDGNVALDTRRGDNNPTAISSIVASSAGNHPVAVESSTPSYDPLETVMVDKDLIAPFLQTLTPGAGFSCIALLLLNHLLRDGRGYDARVRQAFKRLAVVVLSHEIKVGGILRVDLEEEDDLDSNTDDAIDNADELARLATRKFEAMEHAIAAKLIAMSGEAPAESEIDHGANGGRGNRQMSSTSRSQSQSAPASAASTPNSSTHGGRIALAPKDTPSSSQHGISREQILRGIKVGTAGAVGATLFALTGGLAAPGIAAGLAAVAGGSALAAGVTTVLSSAAAITTIFGVGGAGLAGYKMHRRTKGLTEFDFQKEQLGKKSEAELFSTVCISGWLRDARDFQRPWGVSPSHPRIIDKQELLERFYFIHNPDNVHRVPEILKHWKGRYFQLWRALQEKYGADPSNLFPLRNGPRISAELTHEEGLSVDFLMDELGYTPRKKQPPNKKKNQFFGMKPSDANDVVSSKSASSREKKQLQSAQKQLTDSSLKKKKGLLETIGVNSSEIASSLSLFSESETNSINDNSTHTSGSIPDSSSRGLSPRQSTSNNDASTVKPPPKHLLTVWDYHANYGGELYTVRWESDLLMELCDSVADQMIEWGVSATKTILHTTVFATLMTAVTLPYSLVLAANAIDSSWTMATERADRAGVELAKNLIDSNAGHRPVVLVGFSMGARVIYSCMKELARHQEIWEDHQQKKKLPPSKRKQKDKSQGDDQLKYIREPASIVEDAILMGTPNHISLKSWEACRRVVAGRLVNCYSRKDLILSLMFQMKKFQGILRAICGTSPVTVNGVENYDVTDLVTGHTDYCLVSGEILKRVRHGQPQRAAVSNNEVMAMVTTIKVANNDFSLASLADEAELSNR